MHGIFHQIVFDLYIVLFKTIKIDMKTAQEIVNNLINEICYPLKDSSLREYG